ncbi:MAG: APC family permease [Coriobacteriia bacterium]|nr:APC family permease [Coriobacteriia bacterium]
MAGEKDIAALQNLTPEEQLKAMGYEQELKRDLGFGDLLIYGLIFMVPIAPWAIFGSVYNEAHGMVPLVYFIGLIAMIFTALSYSQMAKAIPMAGSVYNYVGKGLHKNAGFFAGWLILLDYILVPTLLYVMAAESMIGIFPNTPRVLWALLFVVLNVAINLSGVSFLKWFNRVILVIEIFFVGWLLVIFVSALNGGVIPDANWSIKPFWNPEIMTPPLLAAALSIAVLSFLGFDGISTLAEETRGGRKTAGRAMVIALLIVAVLFISQTWLASLLMGEFAVIPDEQIGNAFFEIIRQVAGNGVVNLFFLVNILAVGIANALAAQAACSRILYSMSRDGQLPAFLHHINSRQVPSYAIIFVAFISAILVTFFVGQIGTLSSMVNFGALSGFILLHLTVIYFYSIKHKNKNIFLHLIVPIIGFLIISYVLINAGTEAQVAGLIWLALGFLLFLYYKKKGISIEMADEE